MVEAWFLTCLGNSRIIIGPPFHSDGGLLGRRRAHAGLAGSRRAALPVVYTRRTCCERINSQAQAPGIERPNVRNGHSVRRSPSPCRQGASAQRGEPGDPPVADRGDSHRQSTTGERGSVALETAHRLILALLGPLYEKIYNPSG